MYYKYNELQKKQSKVIATKLKTGLVSLAVVLTSSAAVLPSFVHAQGGTPSVDASTCNNSSTIAQYDATFPDGTIKARSNPNFVVSGINLCPAQFNVRIVSVTTAYVYDFATNTYNIAPTRGYPITETSKDITVKPGAFSVTVKLADKPTDRVLQMRTQMTMYMSSSFDASGRLSVGATALASDTASWTQTNFITL